MDTPYLQQLSDNSVKFQTAIEQLLSKYKILPVGTGYIDLILPRQKALVLIKELAQLPVVVERLSWWCLNIPESKITPDCPHGGGGPSNRFGPGWFSECYHYSFIEVTDLGVDLNNASTEPGQLAAECERVVCNYIENVLPSESFYSECLHPGLWLHVPRTWERQEYFVNW